MLFRSADANELGLLGICGGGGYSIKAAQTDKRFKSVATVSMFNTGDARRNGFMRSQKDTVKELIRDVTEDDVDKLLKIPIRRISLYDINKNREEVREINNRLKEIAKLLKNLKGYAISVLDGIAAKLPAETTRSEERL